MKKFEVTKEFTFDIRECIPRFFQATGECKTTAGGDECRKSDCPTQTIITVMACDVEDACRQIKQRFQNFKLQKLIVFSKPALTRDDNGQDTTCNEDVTPTPENCGECCDIISEPEPEPFSNFREPSSNSGGGDLHYEYSTSSLNEYDILPSTIYDDEEDEEVAPRRIVKSFESPGQVAKYTFWGSGVLEFHGEPEIETTDVGELPINLTFEQEITDITRIQAFVPLAPLPLPRTNELVRISKCSTLFTLNLELRHNLHKIKGFSQFLKTNGIEVPGSIIPGSQKTDFIKLTYNVKNDQWYGGVTYSGQSSVGSFSETWSANVGFGHEEGRWKLSLMVINAQPNKRYLSRLLSYYSMETICPSNDVFFGLKFGFKFDIDVNGLLSIPASSQPIVLNDDSGFFEDLKINFRILPQNRGTGSSQILVDNTRAYDDTLTGGI